MGIAAAGVSPVVVAVYLIPHWDDLVFWGILGLAIPMAVGGAMYTWRHIEFTVLGK